jgi:hypothetical protein
MQVIAGSKSTRQKSPTRVRSGSGSGRAVHGGDRHGELKRLQPVGSYRKPGFAFRATSIPIARSTRVQAGNWRNIPTFPDLARRLKSIRGRAGLRESSEDDPLAAFGLDAIDLRWTLKDIDSKRAWIINKDHLPKLIELGLVEMRDGAPYLTTAGQNTAWQR